MIYNFSEAKKENDVVEKELLELKKEYEKPKMSQEQLEKLKLKMEEANMENKKGNKKVMGKVAVAAAVVVGGFTLLPNTSANIAHAMEQIPVIGQLVDVVTFRNYENETEKSYANIEVPEVELQEEVADSQKQETLEKTAEEINQEIQRITDELVAEYKTYLDNEEGYKEVVVNSEVLATTEDYFSLKLLCYESAASGYQWNYYYTIDLETGERLQLKDIFVEDSDYITVISDDIKKQMAEQMEADENVYYWLNDEMEEMNFKSITEDTAFYVNKNGNVVIGFNEGDVAPMYMGAVEFEIMSEVVKDIRKK